MGAVEIYHDDQWMAVCDDGFNGLAARVVCQTLGYKEGVVVLGSAFGETTDQSECGALIVAATKRICSTATLNSRTNPCARNTSRFIVVTSKSTIQVKVQIHSLKTTSS